MSNQRPDGQFNAKNGVLKGKSSYSSKFQCRKFKIIPRNEMAKFLCYLQTAQLLWHTKRYASILFCKQRGVYMALNYPTHLFKCKIYSLKCVRMTVFDFPVHISFIYQSYTGAKLLIADEKGKLLSRLKTLWYNIRCRCCKTEIFSPSCTFT